MAWWPQGCGSRTAVRVSSLLAARQGMSPLRSMVLESVARSSLCRANVYYVNYSGRRSCDAERPGVGHDSSLPTYKPTPLTRPDPTREVSEPRGDSATDAQSFKFEWILTLALRPSCRNAFFWMPRCASEASAASVGRLELRCDRSPPNKPNSDLDRRLIQPESRGRRSFRIPCIS